MHDQRTHQPGPAYAIVVSIVSIVSIASIAAPAVAGSFTGADLQPLDQGQYWEYSGSEGGTVSGRADGIREVLGEPTTILRWEYTGEDSYLLENYWSVQDGIVRVHGFHNFTAGLVIAYDPPIIYLPGSFDVGDVWCQETVTYTSLDGEGDPGDPIEICFTAIETAVLEVPAGTFETVAVTQTLPGLLGMGSASRTDVLGASRTDVLGHVRVAGIATWLASDVGRVRFGGIEVYSLEGFGESVPVRSGSWGRIKALYDDAR
jgi:hypothetical protein